MMKDRGDIDSIVFFGSSYSDGGRGVALFVETDPNGTLGNTQFYPFGRVSDGYVYPDYVLDLLGIEEDNALNLALSGAQATTDRQFPGHPDVDWDLSGQVQDYIAELGDGDASTTAASLIIGTNDVRAPLDQPGYISTGSINADAKAFGDYLFDAFVEQIGILEEVGVKTFYVGTLQTLSTFPGAATQSDEQNYASDIAINQFNDRVRDDLDGLGSDLNFSAIDFQILFEEIQADPDAFGFRDYTSSRIISEDGVSVLDPELKGVPNEQIAFADPIHPSDAVHQIEAAFMAESVQSEVVFGTYRDDKIRGDKSDDMIFGRVGDDKLLGKKGDDVMFGGLDADTIRGGSGDDILVGGVGDDKIDGNQGNDVIATGDGDDIVNAGAGDDVLIQRGGSDILKGGAGDDIFVFVQDELFGKTSDPKAENIFYGGSGQDTLLLFVEDASNYDVSDDHVSLKGLNITITGIEDVVLFEGLPSADAIDRGNALLAEADLWGLI